MFRARHGFVVAAFLASVSAGCVSTPVRTSPPRPEVARLAAVNSRPIALEVTVPTALTGSVGHQFLFFLIPFGTVSLEDARGALFDGALEELALAGYTPFAAEHRTAGRGDPHKQLRLTLADLSVSAYDLLFFRRVRAAMRIDAQLVGRDGRVARSWSATRSYTETRRFGFEKDLRAVFLEAQKECLREIIRELRL